MCEVNDKTHVRGSRYPSPTLWHLANSEKKMKDRYLRVTSTSPQNALPSASMISKKMSMDGHEAPANRQCTWTHGQKNGHTPPPILSHIGDCSSPGTIKKVTYEENNTSCRNWCSRYSQIFLMKAIPPQAKPEDMSNSTEENDFQDHA